MIPVAFDLRDPVRSGIARVARSLARSFARQSRGRFRISLAGPARQLEGLGVSTWGPDIVRIVDWDAKRYSAAAELQWRQVQSAVGDAVWYFPHWDIPWHSVPPRYVMTVHDIAHLRLSTFSAARRFIARRWMRHAVTRATGVAAVTEFTRRELLAVFPGIDQTVQVIPNGVEPLFFSPTPMPAALSATLPAAPFMLSVGNLKRHKNLALGPQVLERLPHIHWVVVGEWFSDWHEVERLARSLGVAGRISYIGYQPDDVLNSVYRRAVCLFFPSRYEGFGLPVLEALAAGTPVVASNAAGIVETLAGFGSTCDADDADEFASAVARVETAGRAGSAEGVAHARRYDWARSAAKLAAMLESARS